MGENQDYLMKYLRKIKADGRGERTRLTAENTLTHFIEWCGDRKLEAFTEDDVYDFIDYCEERTYLKKGVKTKLSPSTIAKEKTIVKKFLAFINPQLGTVIKLKAPKYELPDILTPEEIEELINVGITLRDKAIVATFYESGARRGELLSVRLKHVTFDEYGAIFSLPTSKTKPRRVRLIFAASYLRQFIDCHPLKDNREAFLFCSLHAPYGVISSSGLHYQLRSLAERAGIPIEKVHPHNFRHSAATHLSQHLTEAQLKEMFGWTQGSKMTATYVHLAAKDIDRAILQLHGLAKKPEKKLSIIKCARCKEVNPSTVLYCGKCGLPLTEDATTRLKESQAETQLSTFEILRNDPELANNLEQILRDLKSKN